MRRSVKFVPSVAYLEPRIALSGDDPPHDPLPDPEPPPPPYPGDDPPIQYPKLPPSGPIGPGFVRVMGDTNMPETGHLNPLILQPVVSPPTTVIAAVRRL